MSDSLMFIDYLYDVNGNRERIVLPRTDPFEDYDEGKFRERFRLSKATVSRLLAEVSCSHNKFFASHLT